MTTPTLTDLPVTAVRSHPQNVRRTLRGIDELAASIKAEGLHQPVVVAPDGDDQYVVVLGNSRRAAVAQLGWDTIPCLVRADLDSEEKVLSAMLAENCARNDLTAIEEGDAFQRLLDLDLSAATVAKRAGRSKKQVTDRVKVAGQSDKVRTAVDDGQLSLTNALALAEFYDDDEQYTKIEAAIGTVRFDYELRTAIDIRKNLAEGERVYREALDAGARELDRDALPEGHTLVRIWRPDEDEKTTEDVRFEVNDAVRPEYQPPSLMWWRIVPPSPPATDDGGAAADAGADTPGTGQAAPPRYQVTPEDPEERKHLDAAEENKQARWEAVLAAAAEPTPDMVRWGSGRTVRDIVNEEWLDPGLLYAVAFAEQAQVWDDDAVARLLDEAATWGSDRTLVVIALAGVKHLIAPGFRPAGYWWGSAETRELFRDLVYVFGYTLTPSEEWLLDHFDDGNAVA